MPADRVCFLFPTRTDMPVIWNGRGVRRSNLMVSAQGGRLRQRT